MYFSPGSKKKISMKIEEDNPYLIVKYERFLLLKKFRGVTTSLKLRGWRKNWEGGQNIKNVLTFYVFGMKF